MPTVEVQWTPNTATPATEYAVYYRERRDPPGLWIAGPSSRGTQVDLVFGKADQAYDIAVAPIVAGVEADEEDWSVTTYRPNTFEDFTSPTTPTGFTCEQDHGDIIAQWTTVNDPSIDHFEIRSGASTWGAATKVATAPASASSVKFAWVSTGTVKYAIAGVSAEGDYGAASAFVTVVIQAEQYSPVQGTVDEHATGFAGTKTNATVNGGSGDLEITAVAATIDNATDTIDNASAWIIEWDELTPATYVTATVDAGLVVHEKIDLTVAVASSGTTVPTIDECRMVIDPIENAAGAITTGTRAPADKYTIDGLPLAGHGYTVEIDTAQDGVPTWDGYRTWIPGCYYRYRQVRLRITLTYEWYGVFGITAFTWRRLRQNRKDEQTVTIVGTGGTALTWDTTFTAAPKVTVSSIGASGYYATAESVTTSGCVVRAWDAAGSEQGSATVHVHALGV